MHLQLPAASSTFAPSLLSLNVIYSFVTMRLLIVDFLDSYSHNIPPFLHRSWNGDRSLLIDIKPYNTLTEHDVHSVISLYHGVVLSAGPGTVDDARDLGTFTPALLSHRPDIPIYGICLGFQAICKHFGGTIHRLASPHHGLVSDILDPQGNSLERKATRYHSLEARLNEKALEHLQLQAISTNHGNPLDTSVMEVRHHTLPYWGVQYHPESVYSSGCEVTVQPFLQAASKRILESGLATNGVKSSNTSSMLEPIPPKPSGKSVAWKSIECETDLLDMLPFIRDGSNDYVLLDSSSKGQWDILAAVNTASLFNYSVRGKLLSFKSLRSGTDSNDSDLFNKQCRATLEDAWSFLRTVSARNIYVDGPPEVPFWGGFVGYFGYELGLSELGLDAYRPNSHSIPEYGDIQLLWSTETLVYNKSTKTLYAISLNQDVSWIDATLKHAKSSDPSSQEPVTVSWEHQYKIDHPDGQGYVNQIKACQEEILAGNSYELCLTAPSATRKIDTQSTSGHSSDSDGEPSLEHRFRYLRQTTPAAFMSLMHLGGLKALSASPEEFLRYDSQNSVAHAKPIKGTLPKKDAHGHPIGLQMAREKLHEPKVIAENLMIVDLVRHDLSQVSDKVTCPSLMHVDDIGPMYQLISTVRAEVQKDRTAWDLIKKSIPPGSMTGAPKRRSCEILQQLEDNYRGLYSGITGYIDVRGHCRTSVNIRNMIKYPGENHWRIGAGGAITSLSDPVDEWHERQLKADSVCRSLVPRFKILETMLWDPNAKELLYWDEHVNRLLKTTDHFGFDRPSVDLESEIALDLLGPSLVEEMRAAKHGKAGSLVEFIDSIAKGGQSQRLNGHGETNGCSKATGHHEVNGQCEINGQGNGSGHNKVNGKVNDYTNGHIKGHVSSHTNGTDSSQANGHTNGNVNSIGQVSKAKPTTSAKISETLHAWVLYKLWSSRQIDSRLRVSLEIDARGFPSLTSVAIKADTDTHRVEVRLDPRAAATLDLEPFLSFKTNNRGHYVSARDRAGVQGRDEVLMFRPADGPADEKHDDNSTLPGADSDWLTEGSYTNVAVWNAAGGKWLTPGTGCLPGIMRARLLDEEEIVVGDVQRRQLGAGTRVKLFNSVRGVFEGVIRE